MKCQKCKITMVKSKALQNKIVYSNDFGSDAGQKGTTGSRTGKANLIDVMKCPQCGYSKTVLMIKGLFYILEDDMKTPKLCPDPVEHNDWWAKVRGDGDFHVKETMVGNIRVSTVFLGINMTPYQKEANTFETMVFGGDFDKQQMWFSTYDKAVRGHDAMVEIVKLEK